MTVEKTGKRRSASTKSLRGSTTGGNAPDDDERFREGLDPVLVQHLGHGPGAGLPALHLPLPMIRRKVAPADWPASQ
jgi:hypothetical protein